MIPIQSTLLKEGTYSTGKIQAGKIYSYIATNKKSIHLEHPTSNPFNKPQFRNSLSGILSFERASKTVKVNNRLLKLTININKHIFDHGVY